MIATTSIPSWSQPACRMCGKPEHGSLACEIAPGWPEPPKVEWGIRAEDRIANALERIAAALESNQESRSE